MRRFFTEKMNMDQTSWKASYTQVASFDYVVNALIGTILVVLILLSLVEIISGILLIAIIIRLTKFKVKPTNSLNVC